MNKSEVIEIRDEILAAALPHVVFDGWTWDVIERGAQEAGHSADMARAVFCGGVKGALDGFAYWADREMLKTLEGVNVDDLRIRERIRTALVARYEALAPYKDALRQSVQFWMVPTRKPRGGKIVWRTADCIWNWAGDDATDYNRYTKRGLLSGIIVSTTFVWLNDVDEDMGKTKAFLDRRIENVMQLGKVMSRVKRAS